MKVEFEEETSEKLHHFTIFSDVLDRALNVNSAKMSETELRTMLLKLPTFEVQHSNKVIQAMNLSK